MNHPARFSRDEIEHGGSADVHHYKLRFSLPRGRVEMVEIDASDFQHAINRAIDLRLYPNWSEARPLSFTSIDLISVDGVLI